MQTLPCTCRLSRKRASLVLSRYFTFESIDAAEIEKASRILESRRRHRVTYDELDQIGSTQTRNTSFQPHHTLHRPETATSVSIKHLLASAAHLGHAKERTNAAAYSNVYGFRNGLAVIDVRETLVALRRAAAVVKSVVEQDGIVLFVGSPDRGIDRAVEENAKRLGPNGYSVLKWVPGTISNASKIYASIPMPFATKHNEKITPFTLLPSLVILLSPTTTQHAVREITKAGIPTIAITDSNVDPRVVTYPIPANDDSPRAVELIAGVLGMAGKTALSNKKIVYVNKLDKERKEIEDRAAAALKTFQESFAPSNY